VDRFGEELAGSRLLPVRSGLRAKYEKALTSISMDPARRNQVSELLPADRGNKTSRGTYCALVLLFEGAGTEGSSGPVDSRVNRTVGL